MHGNFQVVVPETERTEPPLMATPGVPGIGPDAAAHQFVGQATGLKTEPVVQGENDRNDMGSPTDIGFEFVEIARFAFGSLCSDLGVYDFQQLANWRDKSLAMMVQVIEVLAIERTVGIPEEKGWIISVAISTFEINKAALIVSDLALLLEEVFVDDCSFSLEILDKVTTDSSNVSPHLGDDRGYVLIMEGCSRGMRAASGALHGRTKTRG